MQTQKESTSIESVWELKDSADKVATWLGKKNKDKRKKEEERKRKREEEMAHE